MRANRAWERATHLAERSGIMEPSKPPVITVPGPAIMVTRKIPECGYFRVADNTPAIDPTDDDGNYPRGVHCCYRLA